MKTGKIIQVMGPVVDVEFEDENLPASWISGTTTITRAAALSLAIGIAIQNFPEGAIISMRRALRLPCPPVYYVM